MVKQKLANLRILKGLTQLDMCSILGMSQSQYCRLENGTTKISKKECNQLAKILNAELVDIYEPDDGIYVMVPNEIPLPLPISNFALNTMEKYLPRLEEENRLLLCC